MNPFTQTHQWQGWMFGVLKMAMLTFGVLLGVYFADFFANIIAVVWAVCAITMAGAMYLGVKSMFGDAGSPAPSA